MLVQKKNMVDCFLEAILKSKDRSIVLETEAFSLNEFQHLRATVQKNNNGKTESAIVEYFQHMRLS